MRRLGLYLRSFMEGAAGFIIVVFVPFVGLAILHSQATTGYILGGLLVLCLVFMLGILLFRDAVLIRMRLKSEAKG